MVVENLRARAAGASVAHGPEIVLLTEPEDTLGRHTDVFVPDVEGLVVILIDRRI